MVTDDHTVQVAVGVDLRPAQEAIVNETALGRLHRVADAQGGDPLVEGARLPDGERQLFHDGARPAKFEDRHQVGGGGLGGQHGSQHGNTGANEAGSTVFEKPRRNTDHQLSIGICRFTHGIFSSPGKCAKLVSVVASEASGFILSSLAIQRIFSSALRR